MIDNMENSNVYDDFEYDPTVFEAIFALVAFGTNPYAGKNSHIARSLRARKQPRDRYGRFIKTLGVNIDFDVRLPDGSTHTSVGNFVGVGNNGDLQIFVQNDPHLGTGVFSVKSNNASQYIAHLTPQQLKDAGIEVGKDANGKPISARDAAIIPTIAQLNKQDAPDGWALQKDGSFLSEDGTYRVIPPTGTSKLWTLNSVDANGKEKKLGTHGDLGYALQEVNNLDTVSLMSSADQQKYEDLKTDLAIAKATKAKGDPAAQDAKRQAVKDAENAIESHLNNAKLNENQAPTQEDQTPVAKTPKAQVSDDIRKPADDTRARAWANKIMPAVRKALSVAQDYNKLRSTAGYKMNDQDINNALQNIDKAYGANLIGGGGFDADADSLRSLLKEFIDLPRSFAKDRGKTSTPEELATLADKYKTRQAELGTQINALKTALDTRSKSNAPYADSATVDVSTNAPEVSKYEAPAYAGPAKRGRPAGTGKNQIAAKKAEEGGEAPATATPKKGDELTRAQADALPVGSVVEQDRLVGGGPNAKGPAVKRTTKYTKGEDGWYTEDGTGPYTLPEKTQIIGGSWIDAPKYVGKEDSKAPVAETPAPVEQAPATPEAQAPEATPAPVAETPAPTPDVTPTPNAGPTPEERKAEAEAQKAEAEARTAKAEADKAEADVPPAPVPTPTPAEALKPGQFADAPETGTTKTGTRKRITNAKELDDAPVGTVVHKFSGNGPLSRSAFGEPGSGLGGFSNYWYSMIKGADGQWYKISEKTGKPSGKPLNQAEMRRDANDSYGSTMAIDIPDDGSTPETMYAQSEKIDADVRARVDAGQTPAPEAGPTAEAPATEAGKDGGDNQPPATPATPAPEDNTPSVPDMGATLDPSVLTPGNAQKLADFVKKDTKLTSRVNKVSETHKNSDLLKNVVGKRAVGGKYYVDTQNKGTFQVPKFVHDAVVPGNKDENAPGFSRDGQAPVAPQNVTPAPEAPVNPLADKTDQELQDTINADPAAIANDRRDPNDAEALEYVEKPETQAARAELARRSADQGAQDRADAVARQTRDEKNRFTGPVVPAPEAIEPVATPTPVADDRTVAQLSRKLSSDVAASGEPMAGTGTTGWSTRVLGNGMAVAIYSPSSGVAKKLSPELLAKRKADTEAKLSKMQAHLESRGYVVERKETGALSGLTLNITSIPQGKSKKVDTPAQAEKVEADKANAEQQAEESSNPDVIEAAKEEVQAVDQAVAEATTVEPPSAPREPSIGAFTGKLAEQLDGITDPQQIKDIIDGQEIVYIDFETTGFSSVPGDGALNRPHQMGIIKVKNGQITDRRNIWMNPETPLSQWSKENSKDNDGNDLSDEWLATQKSMKDAMQEATDFIGPDAIIGGQNVQFDLEVLTRTLKEQGIDFSFAGTLDSRDLGKKTLPTWSPESPVGPTKTNKDGSTSASNSLGDLITFLKGEGYDIDLKNAHNADADAEATAKLVSTLLQRAIDKNQNLGNITDKAQIDAISAQEWADYNAQYEAYKPQIAAYFDQTQDANKDARMAQALPVSRESMGVVYDKPATTPATSKTIDPNGDVQAQVQEAIDNGQDITFFYRSGSGDRMRTVTPKGFWTNPKNGKLHAYADDPEDGIKNKSFELAKMESAPVDATPTPAPAPAPSTTDARAPRQIDVNGDIKAQLQSAIDDNNHPVTFRYTDNAGVTTDKIVSPAEIKIASSTGNEILNGTDVQINETRNYVLSRMDNIPAPDATPAPAPTSTPAPARTPDTRAPRVIDVNGDVRAQVDQAIADGNHPITFQYTSTSSGTEVKTVIPDNVVVGPKTGAELLIGFDVNKNDDRKYFLDKMEPIAGTPEIAPAQADKGVPTVAEPSSPDSPNSAPVAGEDSPANPTLEDSVQEDVTPAQVTEVNNATPETSDTTDLSKITTRTTDADYADEAYLPTQEQRNVIDAAVSELDVAVQALAGSGKTSTLVQAAKQLLKYHPDKKIVYIAFNKSVQVEAERRMPKENVEPRTGDSLAWHGMKRINAALHAKLGKKGLATLPDKVADALSIPSTNKNREDIAADVMRVIEKYSISEDDNITKEHFDAATVDYTPENIAYANMAWADINDPNGLIKYTFSHNMKLWALTRPDLGALIPGNGFQKADIIFFDEAQDINPVMARIIRDQNIQKIYVGDSRQAIYGFRGADNELDKVQTDITLPMTSTFRFGQKMAAAGNRMLSLLNSKYKIIGAGKTEGSIVPAGSMTNADAVLVRTNAGRFAEIISELGKGRVVGVTKQDKADADSIIKTVDYLENGGKRPYNFHEDLDGYRTWGKVQADVARGKADKKVEMIHNLVKQYGTGQLASIMNKVVVLKDENDVVDTSGLSPLDLTPGNSGVFLPKVNYDIVDQGDGNVRFNITGPFIEVSKIKDTQLKPNGFKWDGTNKQWYLEGDTASVQAKADAARGIDVADQPKIDVIVMTAHKSKGLEWDNVRIGDDFRGPESDEEGNLLFPEKQEMNLAYVALTRGKEVLDPGSLSWVYDFTDATDEDPNTPSRGIPEGAIQAGQPVGATPDVVSAPDTLDVTPDEVKAPEQTAPVGTTDNPVAPSSQVIDTTTDISEPGTVEQPSADNVDSVQKDNGADKVGGRDLKVVETPQAEPQVAPAPGGGNEPPTSPTPDAGDGRPPKLKRPEGWNPVDFDSIFSLSDDVTRDPRAIAANHSTDDIKNALSKGLVDDSKSKLDGNYVSPRELYEALNQQGVDARRFVAEQYDAANGDTSNVDALNQYYFGTPSMDPNSTSTSVVKPEGPKRQTGNDLIPNTSDSGMDPAPADVTTPEDDPSNIAETYDNVDLKDALVEAVKNDEPGIALETPAGDTVVVPKENVRDALQKQGTDTNKVLDQATGKDTSDRGTPDDVRLDSEDQGPTQDLTKRFVLNHLLQTKDIPDEYKTTLDDIATDENATDAQIDWAVDLLSKQGQATSVTSSQTMQNLPEGTVGVNKQLADPGMIMKAIEAVYPNAKKLARTGDLIVAERRYTDDQGNQFKYELGVVRTSDELFYVYARETNLTTGETKSSRVSPFTHSAKALNNDIFDAQMEMNKRKNTSLWFNKKSKRSHSQYIQDEGSVTLEDGTKEPIHRREEPIHRDLVEAIRAASANETVDAQVIEAVYRHISLHGVSSDALRKLQSDFNIDQATFNKIIDTLNAHISVQYKVRSYGTYPSADGKTPVEAGDIGIHTNGNTGVQRRGVIVQRNGSEWSKNYGYSDYIEFKPIIGRNSDGSYILGKGSSITSKNFAIERTAQGTDGSERQAALQNLIHPPVASTPTTTPPERVAPKAPAKGPETVDINRTDPANPTVEVKGEAKPVTAERTQSVQGMTQTQKDAGQLEVGDFFMTFDPALGMPRVAEVIAVRNDAGKVSVDAVIPNGTDTADLITQDWAVNEDGLSGQIMITMRRPEPEVVAPEKADDALMGHLLTALRAHDTSGLDQKIKNDIADFTSGYINNDEFTKDFIENILSEVTSSPKRGSAPVTDAVAVANNVLDNTDSTEDNGNNIGLQTTVDEALIKKSEIDATGEEDKTPKPLTGYTIKQNANGVYYPEGGIDKKSDDYKGLTDGSILPPALPFVTRDTDDGSVRYFDSTGQRRWGQFGASGAMLRHKNPDGTYEYLLGKRSKGLSTGGGKWSVPGGAHDSAQDANTVGVSAIRELEEELGIYPGGLQIAGGIRKQVVPDWAYDYAVIDGDKSLTNSVQLDPNGEITKIGWFTEAEIRQMLADGKLHSGFDTQLLDGLFAIADANANSPVIPSIPVIPGSLDLNGFQNTGGAGGSNPGGTYVGPDGKRYYAKFQRSPMHAGNEVASAALYNATGVDAANVGHGTLDGRRNVTQSEYINTDGTTTPNNNSALAQKARDGFAVDAWLANWDAMLNDNTLQDENGNPVRVDVGGSMLFRARGTEKGADFGDKVNEIDTLRDPKYGASAAIFGPMTDAEMKASASKLLNINEAQIDQIVDASFFGIADSDKKKVDALKATLKARRQDILNRYGLTDNTPPQGQSPAPTQGEAPATPEVVEAPTVDATPTTTAPAQAGPNDAPEASLDATDSPKMDRSFNAIMTNFNVINDSQNGDNIRVEYGYVDENGNKKMAVLGLRRTDDEWKRSSSGSDASDIVFDPANSKYTLTDAELIAKLDSLGSDQTGVSKVLRFGSRAGETGTVLTPQMLRYGYSLDEGASTQSIPTKFYGSNEEVVLQFKYDYQNGKYKFEGVTPNGDVVEYSIDDIIARSDAGEAFAIGVPRRAMTVGSQADATWIDTPVPGDSMHQSSGGQAFIKESFVANENGEWISSYTGKVVDKATLRSMDSLKVGSARNAWARRTSFDFTLTNRGTVGTPSDASKMVVDSLEVDQLITDGTNNYRVVRAGPRSKNYLNVTTGATLDRAAMRKAWDLNQDKFKFLTGLEGVNIGDAVTEPIAVDKPIAGTAFKADIKFKLPLAKSERVTTHYYTFDGTYWRDNGGNGVSPTILKAAIARGEVYLADTQDIPAMSSMTIQNSATSTPATSGEITRINQKIQQVSSKLDTTFGLSTLQSMSSEQLTEMSTFIDDNLGSDGKLSDMSAAEATIMFYPGLQVRMSRSDLLATLKDLDNPEVVTRGNRTLKSVLDRFDTAFAANRHRLANADAHPMGPLSAGSDKLMELLNTLFPEISDKPDVVTKKSDLTSYNGASPLMYRGVKHITYRDDNQNIVRLDPSELHKEFREADGLWWGKGIYGNGIYHAESIGTPLSYTTAGHQGLSVSKVKAGANVLATVSDDDPAKQGLISYSNELLTAYLISLGYIPGTSQFDNKYNEYWTLLFSNDGTRAGFFGYDALHIMSENYWVSLNRGALVIYDGMYDAWTADNS